MNCLPHRKYCEWVVVTSRIVDHKQTHIQVFMNFGLSLFLYTHTHERTMMHLQAIYKHVTEYTNMNLRCRVDIKLYVGQVENIRLRII